MTKKLCVYLGASAGQSVEVDVEVPEGATVEQIANLAYDAACELADLPSCEIADWDGSFMVNGVEDDKFYYSEDAK